MHAEIHPECVCFASDGVGLDGFRALVCEFPDEGEAGSGPRGRPYFRFACRPVQEKGRTVLTFRENPERLQETEQGCPSGRAYFENLANTLVIAVASQIDPRLPMAGNPEAQHRSIRQAIALWRQTSL